MDGMNGTSQTKIKAKGEERVTVKAKALTHNYCGVRSIKSTDTQLITVSTTQIALVANQFPTCGVISVIQQDTQQIIAMITLTERTKERENQVDKQKVKKATTTKATGNGRAKTSQPITKLNKPHPLYTMKPHPQLK
jgi:hypothetical protein